MVCLLSNYTDHSCICGHVIQSITMTSTKTSWMNEWIKQWKKSSVKYSTVKLYELFSKLAIIMIIQVFMQWNEPLLSSKMNSHKPLTIMMNVQRVSARTTRMHSFLIFNMETTVGAIWPRIPSSIMLTSCLISLHFFCNILPQFC